MQYFLQHFLLSATVNLVNLYSAIQKQQCLIKRTMSKFISKLTKKIYHYFKTFCSLLSSYTYVMAVMCYCIKLVQKKSGNTCNTKKLTTLFYMLRRNFMCNLLHATRCNFCAINPSFHHQPPTLEACGHHPFPYC